MINDPNYNLPKDAFIRLFDNPIPAGDPARSDAPEWAQELDEVVVWAHMGDNGEVTVFVNGEEAGGGGGGDFSTATVEFTGVSPAFMPTAQEVDGVLFTAASQADAIQTVIVPYLLTLEPGETLNSITGSYEELTPGVAYLITGDCVIDISRLG